MPTFHKLREPRLLGRNTGTDENVTDSRNSSSIKLTYGGRSRFMRHFPNNNTMSIHVIRTTKWLVEAENELILD